MSTDYRTDTVAVGHGTDIYYAEAGRGRPVILLHGGGPGASGVANYGRNIDALAEHFRVIVPDLPGYGRSSKTLDQRDPFGSLADAVRGLLDALGIDTADLIGNSYGGACALRLALDTPHRVRKLVLMGPGGIGTTRAAPTPGLNALLNYYSGDGPSRDRLADFIRTYLVYDGSAVPDEIIDQRYLDSIDPEVIASPPLRRPAGPGAIGTLLKMDLTRDRRLKRLAAPTLILWGSEDRVNRPSGAYRLHRTLPNADLVMTAATGHWLQWERPELFNRLVVGFLDAPGGGL